MKKINLSSLSEGTQAAIKKELAAPTVIQWEQLFKEDTPNNAYIAEVLSNLAKQYLGIDTTFDQGRPKYGILRVESLPGGHPKIYTSNYTQDITRIYPGLLEDISLVGVADDGTYATRIMLFWNVQEGNQMPKRVPLLTLLYDKETKKVRVKNHLA